MIARRNFLGVLAGAITASVAVLPRAPYRITFATNDRRRVPPAVASGWPLKPDEVRTWNRGDCYQFIGFRDDGAGVRGHCRAFVYDGEKWQPEKGFTA